MKKKFIVEGEVVTKVKIASDLEIDPTLTLEEIEEDLKAQATDAILCYVTGELEGTMLFSHNEYRLISAVLVDEIRLVND